MSDGIISEQQTLSRADGRVIGYAEYGDPDGIPLLAFHGVPGARFMFRPTALPARQHGIKVIAPDRPGYGLSTPQPGRILADWLDDIAALIRHLALDTFSIVGISGGGPFATSTAAHFGDQVNSLGLVSPMGPLAETLNLAELTFFQRRFFLHLPGRERAVKWGMSGAGSLFRMAPGTSYNMMIATLPAADRDIMRKPEIKAHVIQDVHEALTFDGQGIRDDFVIFSQPWGVDYACITAPTILWQGLDDTIVPIKAALALGRMIPGCRTVELDGEGHFWALKSVDEILEQVKRLAG